MYKVDLVDVPLNETQPTISVKENTKSNKKP